MSDAERERVLVGAAGLRGAEYYGFVTRAAYEVLLSSGAELSLENMLGVTVELVSWLGEKLVSYRARLN